VLDLTARGIRRSREYKKIEAPWALKHEVAAEDWMPATHRGGAQRPARTRDTTTVTRSNRQSAIASTSEQEEKGLKTID
jgi:hypothetical protein